ncbi:MAG TPA: hypothetical protein VH497_13240 [Vicinamibacterales bacterium]|jgi:hypothetical protein
MTVRAAASLVVVSAFAGLASLGAQSAPVPLRGDVPTPQLRCGTSADRDVGGRSGPYALPNGLADGESFTFDQDPPLIAADYTGAITLRRFSVVGDFPTIEFRREDPDVLEGRSETWTRLTSRAVNGQLVSVFEPSWDAAELARSLTRRRIGFDIPFIYWGAVQAPGDAKRYVYLRMAIAGVPSSDVVRVNDQVQFASDVVNIVVPNFDEARVVAGSSGFDVPAASRMFYTYFADAYDVLAFTSASTPVADFGAFHRNVRNAVSGLNISRFDQSALYGSHGVLQGVEVYADDTITRYQDTNHEMAHQWLSNFDWPKIASITRAGHEPSSHSPLWTGGETLIGAVLLGDRRVKSVTEGYDIERTPAPAHYHPIELYAMGLKPASDVPDFAVFTNQGQFDSDSSMSPDPGTHLKDDVTPVSINDVVRVHGFRQGPAPSAWRRATVIVSRENLVSRAEMDYWNFFAQRLSDHSHESRATVDNFASFNRATQNGVTLSTHIVPLDRDAVEQLINIDTPSFGGTSVRGITFSSPIPTRFAVGEQVTLAGHVTAADRSDFDQLMLGFWQVGASTPTRFTSTVSRAGDFAVTIRFSDSDRGRYTLAAYLFWPNSGSQYPRGSLSTISVE